MTHEPDTQAGDIDCPLCGEPVEIITQRYEDGPERVGSCASCVAIVEIGE